MNDSLFPADIRSLPDFSSWVDTGGSQKANGQLRPLKVLIAEDDPRDAEILLEQLGRAGFEPEWTRVDNEEDFRRALPHGFEIILSDFEMRQFTGLRALELLQQSGQNIPFLLVSGTIGEETAVEAMRRGAIDYLLKDRLIRLGPAINRALEQARLRTERQTAVEGLRLFRTLVDQSSDAFEVIDPDNGRFIDINERECRELGYSRGELLTMGVTDIDPNFPPSRWAEFARKIRAEGHATGEGVHRRKDGTTFPIEFNARLVRLDRDYIVTVVRNITERKQAVEALQASEERFRQMAENIDEVFWMTDTEKNRMLYISPAYERIWGRTCTELCANPRTWIDAIVPEDRERVLAAATTKQTTGGYQEEYRIMRPDGSVRWIHDRAFPIRNAAGEVYRVVGVAEDVTAHKQLQEQFLRGQRLEAVGTLAGGVAHDLNNILTPVMMITSLLKERLVEPADLKALGMLETATQRGAGIIRQLLTFSRGASGEKALVQLRHLVKEMVALMHETFPRDIAIKDRCSGNLWPVLGDPTQLHQVLMNLCVNARDAMPEGGVLTLTAENAVPDQAELQSHPRARPGRYVTLTIGDSGHGISPENISRIFDPFFTTKGPGKGTGLGLSTALGIVKSHGGFVTVQSEPKRGTTFRVSLPAAETETVNAAPAEPVALSRGQGETILVVDDEPNVSAATQLLLEDHNYRVLGAANGREALARFIEDPDIVQLVITDMMMPVMGGLALVQALRRIKPELKIVVTTGLDEEPKLAEFAQLGVADVVRKPCQPGELLRTIRSKLDR